MEIGEWIAEMEKRGIRRHGNPLKPPGEAVTVRVRNGNPHIAMGPFSNAKEKMCAYELIEAPGMEEAVALASRHPMAKAATIEVRPVWDELSVDHGAP